MVELSQTVPTVEKLWGARGDRGKGLQQIAYGCGINQEIVKRPDKNFEVVPRRWVVERTFAWLGRQGRFSKDYEVLPEVRESVVYVAMISLMLNRLTS